MKPKRRYNKNDESVFYTVKNTKVLHREDGPALIYSESEFWFRYGYLHRKDGPAVIASNKKEWYVNGFHHRLDGPAVEWSNGDKEWYKHGLLHREDGPAVERLDGGQAWYINGELHREDGPALIHMYGVPTRWCLNGGFFSKEEWFEALTPEQQQKLFYSEYFVK